MELAPVACELCDGSGWVSVTAEDGSSTAHRCECFTERRSRRRLADSGLPDRYLDCSLEEFEIWNPSDPSLERAKRIVQELIDLYPEVDKGLVLMGGVGTGKTHLACAALKQLILDKGARGYFVDFTSLTLDIQMSFGNTDIRREKFLRPVLEAEVLVLDELGAGKVTPWVSDLLYYLVNARYTGRKLTIFTTNYSDTPKSGHEALADRVSARIRSRLFEMCRRVELRGGDYRRERLAHRHER